MINKIVKGIANPQKGLKHLKKMVSDKKFDKGLVTDGVMDQSELDGYLEDFKNSGLQEDLENKLKFFNENVGGTGETVRGNTFSSGAMNFGSGRRLYSLIRKLKPEVVIETGVCNGASSSYILTALDHNNKGKLYSIDFPEIVGEEYQEDSFFEEKGGGVVPGGDKTSGWMVPDHLRGRWELILGKSQDELPPVVEKLDSIDVFIHDGEHSYDCMTFEFEETHQKMSEGSVMLSHDIDMNDSFQDFVAKNNKKLLLLDENLGYFIN